MTDTPRHARLIKETHRHNCHEELTPLGDPYIGSIAECTCGQQYLRREDQRDGRYWSATVAHPLSPASDPA